MLTREVRNFKHGVVDKLEEQSIPVGSASESLNFLTLGDKIELRRGYAVLGTDAGAGKVTGLHVGEVEDSAGTEHIFRTRARKVEYYTEDAGDWTEIGTNTLPAAADGEDVAFDGYKSQAGAQTFLSSPNSSIYKIMNANPGSITDLASTVYRGYIRIKQSRMFLWFRKDSSGGKDEYNLYLSWVDSRSYTTVSAEALGSAAAGTLAFKAAGSKRTCFGVVITHTATGEVFRDNRDGTLTGSLGGTGTINYTTGAFTTSAAATAGTADYQWEDSTDDALADFGFTSPTRVAGEGNVFLQGEGGPLMGVESFGDGEFCFHKKKTYKLVNGLADTSATNTIFRDREGVPNWRALRGTGDGIYYVSAPEKTEPVLKLLNILEGSSEEEPEPITRSVKLSNYLFDKCYVWEWGDYVMFACRTLNSTQNNRILMYHKVWRSVDVVDFYSTVAQTWLGSLVLGESITGNVVQAFSGVADDNAAVGGHWASNLWDLDLPGVLKKCKKLQVEGEIGPNQVVDVQVAIDKGGWTTIGQIKGTGAYVDRSQAVNVGPATLGRTEVGGGGDGLEAYHYFRELSLDVDKFERIKVRFRVALDAATMQEGIGYFSVSAYRFHDIRKKAQKLPAKYREAV